MRRTEVSSETPSAFRRATFELAPTTMANSSTEAMADDPHFFLMIAPGSGMIVPKRAFADAEETNGFRDLIEARIGSVLR